MADVRKYEGVENPMSQRELIGTIQPVEVPSKKQGEPPVQGYSVMLQLNANDDRTKKATEMNPSGGSNLNLATVKFEGKDGTERLGHNRFYTKEQGDKMIEAAGVNVAKARGQDGKIRDDKQVIAFKADLIPSRDGLAVNTSKPMNASEIAEFKGDSKKAAKAMSEQFAAMREAGQKAAEAKSTQRAVPEAPAVDKSAQADGPEMG